MTPQGGIGLFLQKNLLATGEQWIWLYELEVPTDPVTRYRFARTPEVVRFRGNDYYPFPVTHSEMKESDSGDLPSVTLTVSNISREAIATLEAHKGLIDQPVRIILTNKNALTSGDSVMEHDFKVLQATVTAEHVSLQLGDVSLYETFVPGQRMMRHYCRHQYRSAACGYTVSTGDAENYLATCDKSLNGQNGCEAHGTSESNAGVPVIHPNRFGGFPGIPTPTAEGSI